MKQLRVGLVTRKNKHDLRVGVLSQSHLWGQTRTWRIDQKTVWLKASSVARDTERCFIFSGCSDSCANTQKPIDRGDVAILLTLPNMIPLALWHLLTLSQILLKSQLCMPWTWAHTACIPLHCLIDLNTLWTSSRMKNDTLTILGLSAGWMSSLEIICPLLPSPGTPQNALRLNGGIGESLDDRGTDTGLTHTVHCDLSIACQNSTEGTIACH